MLWETVSGLEVGFAFAAYFGQNYIVPYLMVNLAGIRVCL